MISEKMKKALYTLDCYCKSLGINYAITGTAALDILGLTPSSHEPKDIDILLIAPDKDALIALKKQEFISGIGKSEYPDSLGASFIVGDIKVNAILRSDASEDKILDECITVAFIDEVASADYEALVHKAAYAISAKGKLKRLKDYEYLKDMAVSILNTLI